MKLEDLTNIKLDGIDHNDHPDYCDAYISFAKLNGVELTEEQYDKANELLYHEDKYLFIINN